MDRTVYTWVNIREIRRKFENPKFCRNNQKFKMTQNTCFTYPKIPTSDFSFFARKLRKFTINVPGPYILYIFIRAYTVCGASVHGIVPCSKWQGLGSYGPYIGQYRRNLSKIRKSKILSKISKIQTDPKYIFHISKNPKIGFSQFCLENYGN